MADQVHTIQAQAIEHLVDAAGIEIGGEHRLGLHTRAGLSEHVDREDGEIATNAAT